MPSLDVEVVKKLNKILGKYMRNQGVLFWGSTVKETQGNYRPIRVDDDGFLSVIVSSLPDVNLAKIAGTSLTPRDWSLDFAYLQNIDVPVSALLALRVYLQDFETGTTDTTANNCTQTVQSTEVYAGSYALQATIAAGQTGYVETPSRPVAPNQRVTFAFAHKEDANITDVKLIVVWRRSSGGIINTEEYTLTPSTSWQLDARTVVAPKQAATMTLRIQATAGASEGNMYLDEITIDLVGQIFRVDAAGNLMIAIESDGVGLAKESTLNAIKTQTDKLTFDASNFLRIALASDEVAIAKEGTLSSFKGQAYDSVNNRYKVDAEVVANPPNLDVALSTRASESKLEDVRALLDKLEDALATVGTDKLRTSLVDALPSGTNKIGSVDVDNFPTEYPLPSAQVTDLKNVNVQREGSITHINASLSAAGNQTVYTPTSGKKAKVIGFFLKCDSDVDWELRFQTSGNVIAGLPVKGAVAMNGVGMEMPVGDTDEVIEVYADGACTIKGWICIKEV